MMRLNINNLLYGDDYLSSTLLVNNSSYRCILGHLWGQISQNWI